MENILAVAAQAGMLFIIMGAGMFAARMGWVNPEGAKQMSNLVLYVATPCVVMESFRLAGFSSEIAVGMAGAALFAVVCHLLGIAAAKIIFRKTAKREGAVYSMSAAFPNCGFMGIPLVSALLGVEAVLYVTVFIAVFHLFSWTYGVRLFCPEEKPPVRHMVVNPGTVSLALGLLVMALPFELPELVSKPIALIGGLNSPLAMIIMGIYLARTSFLPQKGDRDLWLATGIRLAAVPLLLLAAMRLCGLSQGWAAACLIVSSAPSATNVLMFAARFEGETSLAARTVAYSNILSILTMPVVIGLGMSA